MVLVRWGPIIGILAVAALFVVLFFGACNVSDDDINQKVHREVATTLAGLETPTVPSTPVPTPAMKQFLASEEIEVMILREIEKALAAEPTSPAPTPTPSVSLSIEQVEALIAKEVAAALAPTATATPTATPEPPVGIKPVIWRVEPEISAGNALIVNLQVETNIATRLDIKYGNDSSGWYEAPTSDEVLRVHERHLLRLKADKEYQYLVTATGPDGQKSRAIQGKFKTGVLPGDLAALQLGVEGTATVPLVLADYGTESSTGLVVTDGEGDIVWYIDWSSLSEGVLPGPVIQREDYSLVAIPHPVGLVEFSPLGEVGRKVLNSENGYFHHDLRETEDGSLLTIADVTVEVDLTSIGLGESELVAVATIRRVDFETGRDEVIWNALDHIDIIEHNAQRFDPWALTGSGRDWLHLNTLSIGTRGNLPPLVTQP